MKTHLKSALESVQITDANLTGAYFAAVKQGDQFAEIVLSDLLESARKLERRIARALDAAKAKDAPDEERNQRALSALDQCFVAEVSE